MVLDLGTRGHILGILHNFPYVSFPHKYRHKHRHNLSIDLLILHSLFEKNFNPKVLPKGILFRPNELNYQIIIEAIVLGQLLYSRKGGMG